MKKYLIKIGLFFTIVLLVDLSFGVACKYLVAHAKGGTIKQVDKTVNEQMADIVILGSSRARHHYVPKILHDTLGLTAYNGGVDGNGVVLAKGLYTIMLNRYHPKLLIYDITSGFEFYGTSNDYSTYLGYLRPYFYEKGIGDVVTRMDKNERYKNLSAMFRYNSKIIDLMKDQFVGYTILDGYTPLFGELKGERSLLIEERKPVDSIKMSMLKELIDQSRTANVKIVFVASPKFSVANSETYDVFKELCENEMVEFWDYYCDQRFQKSVLFADGVHLNDQGAHAFTAEVASRLKHYWEQ